MSETIKSNENSYESSLDNLKEVDYVKVKVEENLHSLAKDAATQLFYTLDTENDKVVYNMDTVKDFLNKAKDNLSSQDKNLVMMAVQIMLESKWYDVGKIDGLFWSNTANAVRAFQRENGLQVDGDPWIQTITKLLWDDVNEYSGWNSSNTNDNWGENAWWGQVSNENYEQLDNGEMTDDLFNAINVSELVDISDWKVKLKDGIEKTEWGRKYIEINWTKFYEWSENCNWLWYSDVWTFVFIWEHKDGIANWKWKYVCANGEVYEWECKDNMRNWKWKCVYADGDVYEWEYKDDMANWKWKCVYADGDVYEWEFKDGKRNWKWKYVWSDWDVYVYEWEFKDGKSNWYWKQVWKDWHIDEWIFREDVYDKAQTEYYKKKCDVVLNSMKKDVATVEYRFKKIWQPFEGDKTKYPNKTTYEKSDFINDVYQILAKYVNLTWEKWSDGKYTWILDYSKYPDRWPWKDKAVPSKYFRDLNRADEFTERISSFIDMIGDKRAITEINKPEQII